MRIAVIGTGYVGLVTGTCFAKLGHDVTCVDVIKEKVDKINAGNPPIYEDGLENLLKEVLAKNFRATTDLKTAISASDCAFVSVGTPSNKDGSIDLKYIRMVAEQIGDILKDDTRDFSVIVKSTVVPGTSDEVKKIVSEHAGRDISVGMNPEFLKEGVAIDDFMKPDRIVLGGDEKAKKALREVYASFDAPKMECDRRTAEMIKYASNAFLATKISFINEIGNACKELNINTYEVAKGMGLDARISPKFLASGMGFGGSCFPKDVKALVAKMKQVGTGTRVMDAVLQVNEEQPLRMITLAKKHTPLQGKTAAVLGLAFKNGTDDIRESRSIPLVEALLKEGAKVKARDPQAEENSRELFGDKIQYSPSAQECVKGADVIFIATDWDEFKDQSLYANALVIDGRNLAKKETDYEGITW